MGWLGIMNVKAIAEEAVAAALDGAEQAKDKIVETARNTRVALDGVKTTALDTLDSAKAKIHEATKPNESLPGSDT